jgi:CDP-6-deoxy-D-xylo-4-hexulose-3-dehydrase
MKDWLFPAAFSSWKPYDGSTEWAAYERVLRSGRLTMGPETEAFEEEIAAYHGRRHAIAVNSGSSANLVAVAAIRHWHVDEGYINEEEGPYEGRFVAPGVAWSTTYSPALQHRYWPTIIDVDDTWNAPLTRSEPLTVIASILGSPGHLSDWRCATSRWQKQLLLEDNCESIGGRTSEGRLTGTFGDLSTGSGFYSHQISAVELGWILTDDDELARLCRLLRNHGNEGWGREEFEGRYSFSLFGYNVRPVEAHCAVARKQLKRLDEMIFARRRNISHFIACTLEAPIQHQQQRGTPSPFGLAFEVLDPTRRAPLARALAMAGIDSRPPTGGSFLKHPYGVPWRDQKTPRADLVHERGMFLGCAPWPIPELIEKAVAVMREVL